ncbi:MAG: protein kinase, partial [Planctomycetota bacterium]
ELAPTLAPEPEPERTLWQQAGEAEDTAETEPEGTLWATLAPSARVELAPTLAPEPEPERTLWQQAGEAEDTAETEPEGTLWATLAPSSSREEESTADGPGEALAAEPERTLWQGAGAAEETAETEHEGTFWGTLAPGARAAGSEGTAELAPTPSERAAEPAAAAAHEGTRPTEEGTVWGRVDAASPPASQTSQAPPEGEGTFWGTIAPGPARAAGAAPASPAEALAALRDACLRAWAQEQGVASADLERLASQGPLLDELVLSGLVPEERVFEQVAGPERPLSCAACAATFALPEGLASYGYTRPCPACGAALRAPEPTRGATAGAAPATNAPAAAEAGGGRRRLGPFEIVGRLGKGGMGQVYEGRREDGVRVALKVLKLELATRPSQLRRFEREARALTRLEHPNVVRLVASGTDAGRTYLALELIDGLDLHVLLHAHPQGIALPLAAHIVTGCARGLRAAHAAGLVHRDVKPGNVLLTRAGEVKLTDFGIALEEDVSIRLTQAGALLGTPQYLAPEATRGQGDGPSLDLYALGCLAYRALSGRLPFREGTVTALLQAHATKAPPPLPASVPAPVAELVLGLLAKDPAQRPSLERVEAGLAPFLPAPEEAARLLAAATPAERPAREARSRATASRGLGRTSATQDTLTTGRTFHNYLLKEELGRGGMGVVYRGYHVKLRKPVAVKVMLSGALAGEAEKRRFLREAESAAALQHPYIVGVLDSGEWEGNLYLAMDFVEGRALNHHYKEHPGREPLLRLFAKICEGVAHAHARGVIHRDLKPDNIIVDAQEDPHILDFGIAKRMSSPEAEPEAADLTTEGDIMGTLRYMPPEQAGGRVQDIDVRSDVYTLGGILYELVTGGQTPFPRGNMMEMLQRIASEEAAAPSTKAPDVPWELDAICLKCLAKARDDRYQSALELGQDLQRYLRGEPIRAKRATLAYRLRKWVSRNRRRVALGAAAVALLLALLGSWLVDRAQQRAARQEAARQAALEGWADAAAGRFSAASERFGVALEGLRPGEPIPAGEALLARVPEDQRVGYLDREVAARWKRYAQERVDLERALHQVQLGDEALGSGALERALEALSAASALASDHAAVRGLRARVAAALRARGLERLAAPETDDGLRRAEEDLRQAGELGEPRAGDGLAEVARVRERLLAARRLAEARGEARQHVEAARAARREAQAAAARQEVEGARGLLRDAQRALTLALAKTPQDPEVEGLKVDLHLELARYALGEGRVGLAEQELKDARIYGRHLDAVAALHSQVLVADRNARRLRELVEEAQRHYAEGRFETAQRRAQEALQLAPEDPEVSRLAALAAARAEALRQRSAGRLAEERRALRVAAKLQPSPDIAQRLEELRLELAADWLEVGRRRLEEAGARGEGYGAAIEAFEQALALDPRSAAAASGRADAYARKDLPASAVYVSVSLAELTENRRRGTLRLYVDRGEVSCGAYAEFLAAGGYELRRVWSEAGWAAREALRDATGRRAPAGWVDGAPPKGSLQLPVTGVSYHEAEAYARWRGARLPREDEWRLAACYEPARGWRRDPWQGAAPSARGALQPARQSPTDLSPWGALDMGRNASEWTAPGDPLGPPVVRGLSYRSLPADEEVGVLEWRKLPHPAYRDAALGFRCVQDVPAPPPFEPPPEEER